jgi:uncharacterized protein (DUF2267 family)
MAAADGLRLLLAGDVMLGRGVDQVLPHPGEPGLFEDHARSAEDYVRLAERAGGAIARPLAFEAVWGAAPAALARQPVDLRLVNLETAVTRRGRPAPKGINYRMTPSNLPALAAFDVDAVSLANNHVLDRGKPILYGTGDLVNDYEGIAGAEAYRGDLVLLYVVTLAAPDEADPVWLQGRLNREYGRFGGRVVRREDAGFELSWRRARAGRGRVCAGSSRIHMRCAITVARPDGPGSDREAVMKDTHVAVLDHTVQQTNLWLKRLTDDHQFRDRSQAYTALRAVLHALRDRLTPAQAVHLGAQLPTLVRGIYYEGWRLADTPSRERTVDDFADHVAAELPPRFARDPLSTAQAVFAVLGAEIDPGEMAKVGHALPAAIRKYWPVTA